MGKGVKIIAFSINLTLTHFYHNFLCGKENVAIKLYFTTLIFHPNIIKEEHVTLRSTLLSPFNLPLAKETCTKRSVIVSPIVTMMIVVMVMTMMVVMVTTTILVVVMVIILESFYIYYNPQHHFKTKNL